MAMKKKGTNRQVRLEGVAFCKSSEAGKERIYILWEMKEALRAVMYEKWWEVTMARIRLYKAL